VYNLSMAQVVLQRPSRWRRIQFTFASLGWRRALLELATHRRPYEPATDHSFDERHGTDTAGAVEPAELGIADADTRDKAILYLPSPPAVSRWMFDHVGIEPAQFTFVDLGCGKARVLLVAAERPFYRVIGVEISAELAAVARRNIERYQPPSRRVREIEIVNVDVTTFELPPTNVLVHLYHPFDPEITAAVLRRLQASLADAPRRVVIAYLAYTSAVEPVTQMLAGFPWLRRTRYEESVRGHYNWLLYSN
jgi:SAM-dependent methyltransferase